MDIINLIIKLFERNGGSGEIYNAMDSGDMVDMVRAADRAISQLNIIKEISISNKRSLEKSKELRDIGNGHYKSGKIYEALVAYNMAIANASSGKLELLLAVSNRSAVLFTMRSIYCIADIQVCFTMGCPPELAQKLNKRMLDAQVFIQEESFRDMVSNNQFISTFFTTEFKRNKDVTCASSDIAFSTKDGVRQITAKRKISPGKIVAIEPALVTCSSNGYDFLSCYYCNKLVMNLCPCLKCCYAMFCSDKCRSLCMSDYHSIECQIIDLLENIYSDTKIRLTVRAAIKLSLNLGWDRFIGASEDIGSSRMRTASTKEMYSAEDPLSMLCYDDNQELVEGRMFNGSIICAIVMKHFGKVPNYFPKENAKSAAAKKAMSKIMFHLYVHFTNTVCLNNSAYDYKSVSYKSVAHTSLGWFSMSSKLKHSCQPNLLVVGLNNQIALLTLRTIEKGEELTISFIEHFLDYDLRRSSASVSNFRATQLFMITKKFCSCNVCTEDWSYGDLEYEPMTDRQADLNRRYQSVAKNISINFNKSSLQLVCEMLDTFSIKSRQYHDAFRTLKQFLCICQCKLTDNRCYSELG